MYPQHASSSDRTEQNDVYFFFVLAAKPKVAFYAALTNAGDVGPFNTDIPLKYFKVFTNIGNAYNRDTGKVLQVTRADMFCE